MASRGQSQALNQAAHQSCSAHAQPEETSFVCAKKGLSPSWFSKLPSPSPDLCPLSGLGLLEKKARKPCMLLLLPHPHLTKPAACLNVRKGMCRAEMWMNITNCHPVIHYRNVQSIPIQRVNPAAKMFCMYACTYMKDGAH